MYCCHMRDAANNSSVVLGYDERSMVAKTAVLATPLYGLPYQHPLVRWNDEAIDSILGWAEKCVPVTCRVYLVGLL